MTGPSISWNLDRYLLLDRAPTCEFLLVIIVLVEAFMEALPNYPLGIRNLWHGG